MLRLKSSSIPVFGKVVEDGVGVGVEVGPPEVGVGVLVGVIVGEEPFVGVTEEVNLR